MMPPSQKPEPGDCSREMKIKVSASVICADLADLGSQVKELQEAGVDMLHFDVMDGHFVRNLGLGPVVMQWLRKETTLPFEVHLMIEHPEQYIVRFAEAGSQIIAVHIEATDDFRKIAEQIRAAGASPAIALNPETPIEQIEPFLDEVSQALVMTVQPGFTGQPLVKDAISKIRGIRQAILNKGLSVDIATDGNVSFENAPMMVSAGANVLVCGTSSLFSPEVTFSEAVRRLRNSASSCARA